MWVGKGMGLECVVLISGDCIICVMVVYDQQGVLFVLLDFNGVGVKDFGDVMSENVNQFLVSWFCGV